ncbi:hypothetical protein [Burkholderia ubonensis]|nr:hypothetical protein [Burkholderia ubonensis]
MHTVAVLALPAFRLDALADADTVIVPGTSVPLAPASLIAPEWPARRR